MSRAIVGLFLFSIPFASPAFTATLLVPDEYPTIQAAVDSAAPLDTILVGPGTYTDGPPCVNLDKPVVLTSVAGAETTIIDAAGAGSALVNLTGAPGLVVDGFTIRNGTGGGSAVLAYWPGGPMTILRCRFEGHSGPALVWSINNEGPHEIAECVFTGNSDLLVAGAGALLFRGNVVTGNTGATMISEFPDYSGLTITDCLIANNSGTAIVTGGYEWQGGVAIDRCTIAGNGQPQVKLQGGVIWFTKTIIVGDLEVGFEFYYPSDITFSQVDLRGNITGYPDYDFIAGWQSNLNADPLFCDPPSGDFTLSAASPCLPSNNSWGVQLGAYGQGCGAVSLSRETWARIKSRYR